ncbi:MAG TPA: GNAT family N-acetyltransferase [Rhizobiales bacterium]|nr:putative acetyltransferase [bacterium BMS3Bbin10]HDO52011.1 GNAT family N-acetyltransferase [Hyphomicrobiales bacterium]
MAESIFMDPSLHLRPAAPDDAEVLCELINIAGEGLPLYVWEHMAEEGESAWAFGRRRARREEGDFSYRNATIAEIEGETAACMIGYPIADRPEDIDTGTMPAIFVPLKELENLAAGSWYTDILSVYPQYRGRGLGTGLLEVAAARAGELGRKRLSLVITDANTRARRLYERCGYVERARREMVKEDWENPSRDWVLLVK